MFSNFFELGFDHIVQSAGWDHLVFIIALLAPFPLKNWKGWLAAISAFSVAHTLAMALQAVAKWPVPTLILEWVVWSTLIVTSGRLVWLKGVYTPKTKLWILAGLFGIVHGAAFWSEASIMLQGQSGFWELWLGFTLGIECAQIAVVLCLFVLRGILEQLGWSAREIALVLASMCLGVALHLAFQ